MFHKILVTGGAGCIGLEVCKQLLQRGCKIRLFDLPEQILRVRQAIPPDSEIFYGSILDFSSLREAMEDCDGIIHLAAMLGVRRTELNKLRCIEVNVAGTKQVLDCAIQHRLKKIVFASSSEVYGEPLRNPVDEEVSTSGKTVYGITKLMGEELCKAYSQRYPGFRHVILRYFNTYGPYQSAQFVVPRFISNVLKDKPPVIFGDGMQKRSYCYVSDLASATIEALFREEANGEVLNIGNGQNAITLVELADLVISAAGKNGKLKPIYQTDFEFADRQIDREIVTRFCETRKARRILGFSPQVPIEKGIRLVMKTGVLFEKWDTSEIPYLQEDQF